MIEALVQTNEDPAGPSVRRVDGSAPLRWLGLGWQDLAEHPAASLAYGLLVAAMGWVVLMFGSSRPALFAASITGFLLVAPLIGAGLYELSRLRAAGEPATFERSLDGVQKCQGELIRFAGVLAVIGVAWIGLSNVLFGWLFAGNPVGSAEVLYPSIFSLGNPGFLLTYMLVGGVLALVSFVVSAISVPLMLDRSTGYMTAMAVSARAVSINLGAMLFWGVLLTALMAIGFATMLLGLVVIFPWLAHATWHAYKEVVADD